MAALRSSFADVEVAAEPVFGMDPTSFDGLVIMSDPVGRFIVSSVIDEGVSPKDTCVRDIPSCGIFSARPTTLTASTCAGMLSTKSSRGK